MGHGREIRRHKSASGFVAPKNQSGLRILYQLHAALLSDVVGHTADAEKYYKLAAKNVRRSTYVLSKGTDITSNAPEKPNGHGGYDTYLTENPDSVVLGPAVARLGTGVKPDLLVSTPAEESPKRSLTSPA